MKTFVDVVGLPSGPVTARVRTKADAKFGKRYTVVFHGAGPISALYREPNGGAAARLFLWALGALDCDRWRALVQSDVAAELSTSPATVSRALALLLRLGLLERAGSGPRQVWRIHEVVAWRGGAELYQRRVRERSAEGMGVQVLPSGPAGVDPIYRAPRRGR